jgi:general secretion pathway protein G
MIDPIRKQFLNCKNSFKNFACSKHLNHRCCNSGFTFIELCIVIAIIATLSAIAIPNYLGYKNKAMVVVAVSDIRIIEQQISLFAEENGGQLPNSLNDLTTINTIKDPWGHPYQYLRLNGGAQNAQGMCRRNMSDNPVNDDYDLYSLGKDGKSKKSFKDKESQDDIVRAYEGQYVGLVSEI